MSMKDYTVERKYSSPVKARSALEKALRDMGLQSVLTRHRIVPLWAELVGPVLSKHSVADRLDGAVLHVAVDSSVYMNELAAHKPVLLEKINDRLDPGLPPVKDIKFFQDSRIRRRESSPSTEETPQPTDEDFNAVQPMLGDVSDPELRSVLTRILAKDRVLKRQRDRKG